jgi:hypothetical protein
MDYIAYRPQGFAGQGDSHLPKIVEGLRRVLTETQSGFAYKVLRMPPMQLDELAGILVDFAEDIHADNGIWAAYERCNREFFGTALPLAAETSSDLDAGFCPERFRHFLWILYPTYFEELIISPTHPDLHRMADAACSFLSGAFGDVPRNSGVKLFLKSSNEFGWDVKQKLVWLGSQSFLFRKMLPRYVHEHRDSQRSIINYVDDFLCQHCTRWSGLGAIDILAGLLDISEDNRSDLRNWYERHAAYYQVQSVDQQTLVAQNVINDQAYPIRLGVGPNPFRRGQMVFGSLVPWRGEWYWSGEQQTWDDDGKLDADDLKRDMKRLHSKVVCRYSKEYEAQVRERAAVMHERVLAFHGGQDLVIYPDGRAMASDWQKEIQEQWEAQSREVRHDVSQKHKLPNGPPQVNLPQDLLQQRDGLGVFINPDEGKEIMTHFTILISGLKKRGKRLTAEEESVIRGIVESSSISPRFVTRVLDEYGSDSVKAAFELKGDLPSYWLDYLLRTRKGHYYRKRYPSLSIA